MSRRANPNGTIVKVSKYTHGKLTLNRDNTLYYKYKTLRSDDKVVMDSLLTYMDSETNLITVGNNTLDAIVTDTRFKHDTIRKCLYRLVANTNLIEPTNQLVMEYLVNPVFAIKGHNDLTVWKSVQALHYNQNVPNLAKFNGLD